MGKYGFFEEYDVPNNLKNASQEICEKWNINGLTDPGYIANVIAFESGLGDGESNFNGNKADTSTFKKIGERLYRSYGSNITSVEEVIEILNKHLGK